MASRTGQLLGEGRIKIKMLVAWGWHQSGPLLDDGVGFAVKASVWSLYATLRMAGKLALNPLCGAALGKLIRHANSVEDGAIV